MEIRPCIDLCSFGVGIFYDRANNFLFICPLPTVVIKIALTKHQLPEKFVEPEKNQRFYEIYLITSALTEIWLSMPDQRFMQLIENIFGCPKEKCQYHIEDTKVITRLDSVIATIRKNRSKQNEPKF